MCFSKINKELEFIDIIFKQFSLVAKKIKNKYDYIVTKNNIKLFIVSVVLKPDKTGVVFIISKNNINFYKEKNILDFEVMYKMCKMLSENVYVAVAQDTGKKIEKILL